MSRGYGKTQQAVLAYLANDPAGRDEDGFPYASTIREIAVGVYGTVDAPSDAQLVAVRRAIRALVADEQRMSRCLLNLGGDPGVVQLA